MPRILLWRIVWHTMLWREDRWRMLLWPPSRPICPLPSPITNTGLPMLPIIFQLVYFARLWFIRSSVFSSACRRLLYANLCPIYAAILNVYAAIFSSAVNCKSIWLQNGRRRMSWEEEGEQMNPFLFATSCEHSRYQVSMFGWGVMDWVTEVGTYNTKSYKPKQSHTNPNKPIQTQTKPYKTEPNQSNQYQTTTEVGVETARLHLHTTDAFLPASFRVQKLTQIFRLRRHTRSYFSGIDSDPEGEHIVRAFLHSVVRSIWYFIWQIRYLYLCKYDNSKYRMGIKLSWQITRCRVITRNMG